MVINEAFWQQSLATKCLCVQHARDVPEVAQVCVRLGRLKGCLPRLQGGAGALPDDQSLPPVEVLLEFYIALDGHVLDGPLPSAYAAANSAGAAWGDREDFETIPLAVKVRFVAAASLCCLHDVDVPADNSSTHSHAQ